MYMKTENPNKAVHNGFGQFQKKIVQAEMTFSCQVPKSVYMSEYQKPSYQKSPLAVLLTRLLTETWTYAWETGGPQKEHQTKTAKTEIHQKHHCTKRHDSSESACGENH